VTCWEVFSCGRIPYPGVDAIDLPRLLDELAQGSPFGYYTIFRAAISESALALSI